MQNRILRHYKRWVRTRKIRREQPELWLIKEGKIGYIQIPKVATRSIQVCLARYYAKLNEEPIPEIWGKKEIRHIEGKTASHISQREIAVAAENNFIFAFVRNPYDRLYSAYKNKTLQTIGSNKKNIFAHHGIDLGISFEDFVNLVCSIPDREIDRHLRSQSWFLTYEGKVIPQFVGRLENFKEDWNELNMKFQLGDLVHRNSTISLDSEDYRIQYSSKLEAMVFNRYREDFEIFGYSRLTV